jgi:hypothetical protein
MVLFIVVGMNVSIHQLSTLQGESITLFEAIREACIRRWSNIVFESDFKLVVDVLQTNHMSVSELNYIIMPIVSRTL